MPSTSDSRGGSGTTSAGTPDEGPDPDFGLLVLDELGRTHTCPVVLRDDRFLGRLRQRQDGQPRMVVTLVTRQGLRLGDVSLSRPHRERGSPVLVEVERISGSLVVVRAWDEDDEGYVERSFPLQPKLM